MTYLLHSDSDLSQVYTGHRCQQSHSLPYTSKHSSNIFLNNDISAFGNIELRFLYANHYDQGILRSTALCMLRTHKLTIPTSTLFFSKDTFFQRVKRT